MKTNKLWAGIAIIGGLFSMNGQIQNTTLTSFGTAAGTAGNGGTYYGANAGTSSTGASNTFIGQSAGNQQNNGAGNTFVGASCGVNSTGGQANSYFGSATGRNTTSGEFNTFIGSSAGAGNTTGSENVYLGWSSGTQNSTGNNNVCLGTFSGNALTGSNNTFIGNYTGQSNKGSRNVCIGNLVGQSTTESDKLLIDNTNTTTPLIWGDFALDQLKLNGKVGIGSVTTFPTVAGGVDLSTYKLFVKGGILANEVRVTTTWADYVFADKYKLAELSDVECFIENNGHLPNTPSAKQVEEEGISVGEIAKLQQEKIEELTLYIIAQDKQLKEQQTELNELKVMVQGLIDKK